jgi:tripartite-type tricarboxylate transporter receptor subunit TctC
MFRALLILAVVVPLQSVAQSTNAFPEKPVRFIVPFLAGGGADALARTVAAKASEALGQQIIVDNRPGAGGNVGALYVAKAAPDGYTLLQGTNGTHAANLALYKSTGYDAVKDFAPVIRLTNIGMVLVVYPDSPIKSVDDLIRDLKVNPGKRTFGSGGNGSAPHMAGEMFKAATGTQITHVPYRGNAGAIVDLLSGRLDMMFDVMANAYPQVKAGKLRALAVLSRDRQDSAPELPTLHSLGVKDFDVSAWDAVFAPAGTPRPVVDKLNAAFRAALTDAKTRESLVGRGAVPVPGTPEDLAKHVEREIPKWAEAVKRSGAQME